MKLKPITERPSSFPVFGEATLLLIRTNADDIRSPVSFSGLASYERLTPDWVYCTIAEAREILLNAKAQQAEDPTPDLLQEIEALKAENQRLRVRLAQIADICDTEV